MLGADFWLGVLIGAIIVAALAAGFIAYSWVDKTD